MKIQYNNILQLYECELYGRTFYGESVSDCIRQGVRYINTVRACAGLSKVL